MGKAFSSICVVLLYAFLVLGRSAYAKMINFFVFGDSTVDTGTNKYLNFTKESGANFFPYGENAAEFFGKPTGRFSDGKVVTDFIAELANLPLIPPYLKPHADLSYGANFASAGAGILEATHKGKVLYNHGARKFLFMSLKDTGCMPGMRLMTNDGSCFAPATYLTEYHNMALEQLLMGFASKLVGFQYTLFDQFKFINARTQTPIKYGFFDGLNACCGCGRFRGLRTCGRNNPKRYHLCRNATTHVWFDSFHYTQGVQRQAAETIWQGKDHLIRPRPLKHFFMDETSQVRHRKQGKAQIASTLGFALSKSI
ncbi:GDSL esterase/lipase 5-like isoform X2 [Amborella trichopoda]|uniref:GDSL esterase/lipase 5-like isoform X2 n=1 Tax=Amborella trichopoda TaxID=13333 RepID=UPI0009BD8B28|nr:GDSL esterase/lipase 5-like isoform X2 [Amborella trichopoda]|eukprot:XP_020522580.1 GDSL esterase/lipase 5-like isoform X2 [Amborella trichopoda]